MSVYTLIGLAGVAVYVASYAALQLKLLDGNGILYSVANVAAAALVLVSLVSDFNLASALIQVIWIAVGVVGLVLRMLRDPVAPQPSTTAQVAISDQVRAWHRQVV